MGGIFSFRKGQADVLGFSKGQAAFLKFALGKGQADVLEKKNYPFRKGPADVFWRLV